ncbi:MAG: glycosyltransferase family 4 protein [Mediterranea sp.]|jgi:glycosyltransferase involved in cell wall biosynthesis|nr:glycosyltransferase family 4 protein [Mediterranea sp.]
MILFDCERMKHPYTGLFTFCDCLAGALQQQAMLHPEHAMGFYVPRAFVGRWGNKCRYAKMNLVHPFFFYNPDIELWHSASQFTRYMPVHTPVVQTVHDLNYLYEPLTEGQKERRNQIVAKHLKRVDYIVAISEATKHDIMKHFDTGDTPLRVIYNGCDRYEGEVTQPRWIPGRPFLFSIGVIHPKKNFHVLPCLLKGNDYELVIAGMYQVPAYAEQILSEARLWGVADRVRLVGPIPEAEKHWYLSHCEAFLFPSIAEGFGLPAIEAMRYGKPTFLSSHTSLPEIGGAQAYYFNYDFDRAAMQREFEEGMADFKGGHKTPEAIRERALSFSWEAAAKQYWEVYNEVLQHRR